MSDTGNKLANADVRSLLTAVTRLETIPQARRFIRDLMTEDEIRMIVGRWRAARMLHEGRSYREIAASTGLSSRTIARISRCVQAGEGGYTAMLAGADDAPHSSAGGPPRGSDGGLSEHRRR